MKKLSKLLRNNLFILVLLCSCTLSDKTSGEVKNFFVMDDIEPPVLLEVQSVSSNSVRLFFSEEVTPYADSFSPNEVQSEGYSILVTMTQGVDAGHEVMLEGRVKDNGGNTTGIKTPVWGYNPDTPEIAINEFTTRGEGNNPDRTELLVSRSGNTAGMVLYNGIPDSWDSRIIFEDMDVEAGDFVVVWWTESLPEGVKNTDGVFNVCAETSDNLPGFNGLLTLSLSPAQGADVVDCIVYSNNSATYEGFGSKTVYERVSKAIAKGWWSQQARPVDSTYNTSTRSMCRRPGSDSWYVCVTKGATFGSANNAQEYSPI